MRNIILQEAKALLREENQYPEAKFTVEIPGSDNKRLKQGMELKSTNPNTYEEGSIVLYVGGEKKGKVVKVVDSQWVTLREPGDYSTPPPAPEPAPEPDPKATPKSTTTQGYERTDRGITPTTIGDEGKGVLGIGARGIGVEALQKTLIDAGYDVGSQGQDGLYGPRTKAAVEQLQKDLGVTEDGIYGPKTHKAWQDKEFKKPEEMNESVYNHWQKLIKG